MHPKMASDIARIDSSVEARLIYAFMLLTDLRFGEMTAAKFRREVRVAAECVRADPAAAERLAVSYGI